MQILVHGWSVVQVEGKRPFAYSVGILETLAHPELVVMDMKLDSALSLINYVGGVIRDNGGMADPDVLRLDGISLVDVHAKHVRSDLFGSWEGYYGEPPRPGDFMQILPPPEVYCACHRHAYRRLDRAA
ncbi:MAG TPA: DUF4262 domain-containing protein [Ilumatobacteraceae bacterium]